jgi:hypothetical protein
MQAKAPARKLTMATSPELPEVYTRLWQVVADYLEPIPLRELRQDDNAARVCREHHAKLIYVLDRLVDRRHLRCDHRGKRESEYWFGTTCLVPFGADPRTPYRDTGSAIAGPRTPVTSIALIASAGNVERADGLQFMQLPSRRGNRLYWRDGRITDLDGNVITESHP